MDKKEISFSRSFDDAKDISLKDEKDLQLLFEVLQEGKGDVLLQVL